MIARLYKRKQNMRRCDPGFAIGEYATACALFAGGDCGSPNIFNSSSKSDLPLRESGGDSVDVQKRILPVDVDVDDGGAVDVAVAASLVPDGLLLVVPVNTTGILDPDGGAYWFDLDRRKMMENCVVYVQTKLNK